MEEVILNEAAILKPVRSRHSRQSLNSFALSGVVTGVSLLIPVTPAVAQEAHVHGLADLNLVRQGQQVQMEFLSPAANLLGFERPPASDEERALFSQVSESLESAEWLIGEALSGCQLTLTALELPEFGSDDHEHEHEGEHGHETKTVKKSFPGGKKIHFQVFSKTTFWIML